MASKQCPRCSEQITGGARFCPACGCPLGGARPLGRYSAKDQVIIIVILLAAAALYMIWHWMGPRQSAPSIPAPERAENAGTSPPADMATFIASLPKEFEPLVSMGNGLMDQGQFALAVECYRRALQIRPQAADVLVDLGACQHALGQFQEAIANFKKGLEYDPAHKIAKFNLGITYADLGDSAQARQWWQQLVDEGAPDQLRYRVGSLLQVMPSGK